jgi:hypothetical protein
MISFGHVGAMRRAGMGGADKGDTYRSGVSWCRRRRVYAAQRVSRMVRIGRTGSRVGWWVWEDELWVMGDAVA